MKRLFSVLLVLVVTAVFGASVSADGRIVSTADFTSVSYGEFKNKVTVTFDINANTFSDGIVGIASSSVAPAAYGDYAICFRIRKGGFFDANNGSNFGKDKEIKYLTGKTYNVEIVADTLNKIYNAYVYIDGVKNTVCENYAFRAKSDTLGKVTARGGGGVAAGLYYIENVVFTQEEGAIEVFSLPNYYSENMVLQRGKKILVRGRGTDGTEITAKLSKGDFTAEGSAVCENGEFVIYMDEAEASLEAYTLTVSSKDITKTIENVFVGDVFLLGGQSNMAQTYEHQTTEQLGGGVTMDNIPQMITDESVKFFKLSQSPSDYETFNVPFETNGWQPLNDSTKKKMSYIGMYFARERLKEESDVPVGLMAVAWRGTTINRWTRKSDDNKTANFTPSSGNIFNNHIAPLAGYPIKGILWYQGESDAQNPVMYKEAFPAMIEDWRRLWNDENLPFLFVQLARYSKENYAPQRLAQMSALELDNTGMAVILDSDMGTYNNIHPLGKEVVAQRLNLLAKKYMYGENIVAEGPIFEKAEIAGEKIIISFRDDTVGDGLCVNNIYGNTGNELCEFEIAEKGGEFVKAKAVINSDNTISVFAEEIDVPAYVRYAYSAVPENANLFNKNGLPASPFVTDERIYSSDSFLSKATDEIEGLVQMAEFDIVPVKNNINGVISFTDSANAITAWNSAGVTMRFEEKGFFEYIDGAVFKTSDIPYEAGRSYRVKVICDFAGKTYSAVVDGEIMCVNAAFRSGSLAMNNMCRFMLRAGNEEAAGEFFVEKYPEIKELGKNEITEAADGEMKVYMVAAPTGDCFAASYKDGFMTSSAYEKKNEGLTVLAVKEENSRLFIWGNMKPVK